MGKRYIELDALEELMAQYAVPYTNLFDELTQLSAEDIIKDMDLLDAGQAFRERDDVVAAQIWTRNDIHAAIRCKRAKGIPVSQDSAFIDRVAVRAKSCLEETSHSWDGIHAAIEQCMSEEEEK